MNRVKRAIIMAAGKGQRMNPVTLHTPKPLVEVNGKRMIDTVIDALYINEINEIYIVVGYLKDKFNMLGYNCIWTDNPTKEWVLDVKDNTVVSCSRNGADKGWKLYSISRWTKEDGKRLKKHLEIEFIEKNNKQIYWDDVAMFCYLKEYNLGIKEMNADDIIEVDSLQELVLLDMNYSCYLRGDEQSEK